MGRPCRGLSFPAGSTQDAPRSVSMMNSGAAAPCAHIGAYRSALDIALGLVENLGVAFGVGEKGRRGMDAPAFQLFSGAEAVMDIARALPGNDLNGLGVWRGDVEGQVLVRDHGHRGGVKELTTRTALAEAEQMSLPP